MSRSHSVRYLAGDRLGVKPEFLEELAGRAVRLYRPFQKNFGTKKRLLANPIEPLKGIQRRINETILREVPMPWHVQARILCVQLLEYDWPGVVLKRIVLFHQVIWDFHFRRPRMDPLHTRKPQRPRESFSSHNRPGSEAVTQPALTSWG